MCSTWPGYCKVTKRWLCVSHEGSRTSVGIVPNLNSWKFESAGEESYAESAGLCALIRVCWSTAHIPEQCTRSRNHRWNYGNCERPIGSSGAGRESGGHGEHVGR